MRYNMHKSRSWSINIPKRIYGCHWKRHGIRLWRGNVLNKAVCNQNVACIFAPHIRVVHQNRVCEKGRATIEHQKRQSWRRCNSQEGSGAERLSGEVACCSNGRRETGGIKLLQTITFNEKVNAASRGLARTWMQMCRVISKQSSPPSCCLLFLSPPPLPMPSHSPSSLPSPSFYDTKEDQGSEAIPYHLFVGYIAVYVYVKVEYMKCISPLDIPLTIDITDK